MADNTTLNAGTGGDVIGSDDIGGVKYQRVKIILGADGVNDGDVASGNALPVTGTITAVTSITNALPAGDNNIGNVDVLTLPSIPAGTNNIGDVDVVSILPATDVFGTGTLGALNAAVTVTSNGTSGCMIRIGSGLTGTVVLEGSTDGFSTSQNISVLNLSTGLSTSAGMTAAGYYRGINTAAWTQLRIRVSSYGSGSATGTINLSTEHNIFTVVQQQASNLNTAAQGDVAHDSPNAGNPIQIGGVAVSGSATPTSVASGDRTRFIANQHGIPYIIAGHPNLITREYDFGTAAQTDVNLAAALVAADERIYITRLEIFADSANTVNVSARVGFGTASVPAASATGVSGMIASHPGIAPGSGIICGNGSGVIAVGAAGEEPRITTSAATSGNTHVIISYFLIDETP